MMYNRYIPQPDGTYRRCRNPETHRPSDQPAQEPPCPPPETPNRAETQKPPHRPVNVPQHSSVPGFLRQLLPPDFDTGDLIVVLLLLLMAGDRPEDRNNAILTLALYFLM